MARARVQAGAAAAEHASAAVATWHRKLYVAAKRGREREGGGVPHRELLLVMATEKASAGLCQTVRWSVGIVRRGQRATTCSIHHGIATIFSNLFILTLTHARKCFGNRFLIETVQLFAITSRCSMPMCSILVSHRVFARLFIA